MTLGNPRKESANHKSDKSLNDPPEAICFFKNSRNSKINKFKKYQVKTVFHLLVLCVRSNRL
jgi:hypothetical protein